MNSSTRDHIFLSYASEDIALAILIYAGLIWRELDVWFDKVNMKPGPWKSQILKAIGCSRFFLVCISKAALRKLGDERPGFQDEELSRAYEIAKEQPVSEFTIVPVRIEKCDRGGKDVRLTTYQQYDLFDDFEKGLDKLAIALGGKSLSDPLAVDTRSNRQKLIDSLMDRGATDAYYGDNEKALESFQKTTKIAPDHAEAWHNTYIMFDRLGHREEAIKAHMRVTKIDPFFYDMEKKRYSSTPSFLKEITKTSIDFQKTTFSNWYENMVRMQDQTISAMDMMLGQNTWIPKNEREAIRSWFNVCQNERKLFKAFADKSLSGYEKYLSGNIKSVTFNK